MNVYIAHDDVIDEWVYSSLSVEPPQERNMPSLAVERDGSIIAGICFWAEENHIAVLSVYSTSPYWCSRRTLSDMFCLPFINYGMEVLRALSDINNNKSNDFIKRLGFQKDGRVRMSCNPEEDAFLWSMLKSECRWINGVH